MKWFKPVGDQPEPADVLLSYDRIRGRWVARLCNAEGTAVMHLSPAQQDEVARVVFAGIGGPNHDAGKLFGKYAARIAIKRNEIDRGPEFKGRPFIGYEVKLISRYGDANEIAKKFLELGCGAAYRLKDGTDVRCIRELGHAGACGFEHAIDPETTDTTVRDGGLEVVGVCKRCGRDATDPLGMIGGEFSPCWGDGAARFRSAERTQAPGFVFVLWPHLGDEGVIVEMNGRKILYAESPTEGDWMVDDQGAMHLHEGSRPGDRMTVRTGATVQALKLYPTLPGEPVRFLERKISWGDDPNHDPKNWPTDPAIASPRWNDNEEGTR